jgi:hypothetical protein
MGPGFDSPATTGVGVKAGIDISKLHFGRKLFGQIFIHIFCTKFHPTDTNLFEHRCSADNNIGSS